MIYKVEHIIHDTDEHGERTKNYIEKIDYVFEKDIRSLHHLYKDFNGDDTLTLEFIQDPDEDWRAPLKVVEIKSL